MRVSMLLCLFAPFVLTQPVHGQEVCGDGVIEGEEQCDRDLVANAGYQFRGNLNCSNFGFDHGTLGCAADCEGWVTTNCYDAGVSVPEQLCGNGVVEHGRFPEQCDSTDPFCSDDCRCRPLPAGSAVCGNGCRDIGEECDGPSISCCLGGVSCSGVCAWDFQCGNDTIEGLEECDDGSDNSDTIRDACRSDCEVASCGDGVVDTGEACDDGAANSDTASDACRTTCREASCGDRVIDLVAGEQCDDGPDNADTPTATCNAICLFPGCGNGYVEPWEECDDGNVIGGDGCSALCDSDETCGNDVVDRDAGEQCDDGNTTSDDGCSPTCQLEFCGDDVLNPGEACDDGNEVDGDGCNATCTSDETCGNGFPDLPVGEECDDGNLERNDGCNELCTIERCANGVIEGAEECDDGAAEPEDGCSALCAVEENWACTGEPSVCERVTTPDAGFDAAPAADAATTDAGADGGIAEGGGGCGCNTGAPADSWPIALGLALLFRRARRRRSW